MDFNHTAMIKLLKSLILILYLLFSTGCGSESPEPTLNVQEENDDSEDKQGEEDEVVNPFGAADPVAHYLWNQSTYMHEINGFYIVSNKQTPTVEPGTPKVTAYEVFNKSVQLFSSFLDQDNDGTIDEDKSTLNVALKDHLVFVIGNQPFVDGISEGDIVNDNHLYAIGMFTDSWPYDATYNGRGWRIDQLNTSMWRPPQFNALWEEVFHTITEGINRYDPEFGYGSGSTLQTILAADIADNTYGLSQQNELENGHYDMNTAVNEYIHQIWMINFAGQNHALNDHQNEALSFIIEHNVPMAVNTDYKLEIGTRVKE